MEEFNRDREDMLDTIRVREKEIMLKNLVIDNFIPPEEVKKVIAPVETLTDMKTLISALLSLSFSLFVLSPMSLL
mgnify:CR=1 FL=1